MSTTTVLFTSLKGGCGTSTACVNIAAALAKKNKRVLLLSLNRYCSSVDMMLGMDSAFVLDITDYPESGIEDICLPVPDLDSLYMALKLPFSDYGNGFSETDFLNAAKNDGSFDFIVVDKTEGDPDSIAKLSSISDMTVIVSTQMNDSIRSAELFAGLLAPKSDAKECIKLLLNCYYTDVRSVGMFMGLDDILNSVGLPLVGIIPFSDKLHASQTHAYVTRDNDVCAAFDNVCRRILGEDVKLLDFLPTKNRRKLLNS